MRIKLLATRQSGPAAAILASAIFVTPVHAHEPATTTQTARTVPASSVPIRISAAPQQLAGDPTQPVLFSTAGTVAGALPASVVFANLPLLGQTQIWQPGANERLADDLLLTVDGCAVSSYSIVVAGTGESGPRFSATTELWDGEPCAPGSSMIAGTQRIHSNVPNNGTFVRLDAVLENPIAVPRRVWLAVTFDTDDAGWILTGEADELGFTEDHFSEDDREVGCNLFIFTNAFAGFAAELRCQFPNDPGGACCRGRVCSELGGTACNGIDGLWHGPERFCSPNQCAPRFSGYRNDQPINIAAPSVDGSLVADDIRLHNSSTPCELAFYRLNSITAPQSGTYDVTVELRASDPDTQLPSALIPDTMFTFVDLPHGLPLTLVTDLFKGVVLPRTVWMVLSTTTNELGWPIAEEAEWGQTADTFAVMNHPDFGPAGEWVPLQIQDDPQSGPIWAGLQAEIVCYEPAPTGACCTDVAGTCVDNVRADQCDGRWQPATTCAENPFSPPCGPRDVCLNATGSCTTPHDTPGCDDPLCCEAVCRGNEFCCTMEWDDACVSDAQDVCTGALANDHCANAQAISGTGLFDFNNAGATTDGAPHGRCLLIGRDEQVANDVWFRWPASCTDTVLVRTCGLASVDTKIAIYDGNAPCPPGDAHLLECDDDRCVESAQSMAVFPAVAGQDYLIRVGTFPGTSAFPRAPGGSGQFRIDCGPPSQAACGTGTDDCCVASSTGACADELCCELVCACDPFCCASEWDSLCAGFGLGGTGCGAASLCRDECNCPHTCGDINGDGLTNLLDVAAFLNCFELPLDLFPECVCADLNLDGLVDFSDFNLLFDLVGRASGKVPPHCP